MSHALVLASTLAFVVVSAIVGGRLLWIARRTRRIPELAVGLGLVLVGSVGYPLGLLARLGIEGFLGSLVSALAALAISGGSASIYVFTCNVFRPHARWARGLSGLAIAALAVYAVAVGWRSFHEPDHAFGRVDGWFFVLQLASMFSYGWTALEAFLYHGMLRRRIAIGLADPVVTNRFLMWALSGVSAFLGSGTMLVIAMLGSEPYSSALGRVGVGLGGFFASIVLWLAFLPPAAYVAWLKRVAPRPLA